MDHYADKFFTYLKVEKNYSKHTLVNYSHDLNDLYAFLAGSKLEDADIFVLRKYLALLKEKGLSKRTVARHMAALRTFFRFLNREGHLKKNPMSALRTPKLEKKLPMVLDENEVSRLMEAPGDDLSGRRDRAILETLYSTCMRVSEVVQLNCEGVDFIGGVARVLGKGSKERVCPIGDRALRCIRHYLELRERAKEGGKKKPWDRALFLNHSPN